MHDTSVTVAGGGSERCRNTTAKLETTLTLYTKNIISQIMKFTTSQEIVTCEGSKGCKFPTASLEWLH